MRDTCCTTPEPPHPGQVIGDVPAAAPEPSHAFAAARHAHLHVERDPASRICKVDLHLRRDVRPSRRPWPAAGALPEQRLPEERCEDVREAPEVGIHRRESAADAGVAEPVVRTTPLRVGQHLVRLRDGAKPPLRVGLAAHVRMELAREPPERALDLRVARVARDAEELVVVLLRRRHQDAPYTSSTSRESS